MNTDGRNGKAKIYLNEFNVLLSDTIYLPLASGLLQAYALTKPEIADNYEFMPIYYKRDIPETILGTFAEPAIAAFSVTSWSEQLCLIVAERVKEKFPECLVVFGGPQVPFDAEDYFAEHKFIDVSVRGEGERAFTEVLIRDLSSKNFEGIAGVSYRDPETGECVRNTEEQPKLPDNDLDVFPSPYLENTFGDMMDLDLKWQAIVETNRGCPFPCAYCFWGQAGLNNKYRYFSLERVENEIEWAGAHGIEYLFCADSNFGMLKRDEEIVKLLARTKKKYNCPERFRVNYGKNTNDRIFNIAKYLHEHELEKAITISFQSFNEEALLNVNRKNIKLSSFKDLQEKYSKHNIPTYSEMILGLPGETYESWVDGMEQSLTAGIRNNIFVYLCQVLPNTKMAEKDYIKEHGIVAVRAPLHEGHGAVRAAGEVTEYENIVVALNSMPRENWKRSAVFSWSLQAFVGLKLGFFLLVYLKYRHGSRYTDFLRYISDMEFSGEEAKFLKENVEKLAELAEHITRGGPKTVIMEEWGNIYWEPEEFFYFNVSNQKDRFYDELLGVARGFLETGGMSFSESELRDVVKYQRHRVPQYTSFEESEVAFDHSIPEYFDTHFQGEESDIRKERQVLRLNDARHFEGNKKLFARDIILRGRKGTRLLQSIEWRGGSPEKWNGSSI